MMEILQLSEKNEMKMQLTQLVNQWTELRSTKGYTSDFQVNFDLKEGKTLPSKSEGFIFYNFQENPPVTEKGIKQQLEEILITVLPAQKTTRKILQGNQILKIIDDVKQKTNKFDFGLGAAFAGTHMGITAGVE